MHSQQSDDILDRAAIAIDELPRMVELCGSEGRADAVADDGALELGQAGKDRQRHAAGLVVSAHGSARSSWSRLLRAKRSSRVTVTMLRECSAAPCRR